MGALVGGLDTGDDDTGENEGILVGEAETGAELGFGVG